MSTDSRSRAWVEISAGALKANFQTLRDSVGPGVPILPMVKADAYGLGVERVVETLDPLGPWGYGVAAVEEGVALRALGVDRPVLVCSPAPPGSYEDAVGSDLILSISDLHGLDRLRDAASRVGKPGRFHLEVDTGMGRAGLDWRDAGRWAPALQERLSEVVAWEGIFTHFHSADGVDGRPTALQWQRLTDTVEALPFHHDELLVHACNSPGALRKPEFAGDLIRPGIFMYGGQAGQGLPDPEAVASLRARIVLLKEPAPGSTLGYGATYQAGAKDRWATVAIGYGDGLPRLLSNRGQALVRGCRVPIIGRISMDVTVVNVAGVPEVGLGDIVTFVGSDGGETISVDEVASHANTISYEVLTGLTKRLPRIWTDDAGY
jgi:alanine racemase